MALLYADGFEWCANTTDLKYKYSVFQDQPWSQATGRLGGFSMDGNNGVSSELTLNLAQNITSWVIGIAYRKPLSCNGAIVGLRDSGTNQVELRINDNGSLSVTRNATIVSTSSEVLLNGIWYYIEWKVTIADSIGANTCLVLLDGNEIINVPAGSDLKNTANAYAQSVFIGAWTANNCRVDDFYVCDQSGGVNDDFLVRPRIQTLYADGNGTTNQWSVTGAASNYQAVDEATPDGDTTYVSSATPGDIDLYTYQNISADIIWGVQTRLIARKDDGATRQIRPVWRTNSTNYTGTTFTMTTSYLAYTGVQDVNPDTLAEWTPTEVNDLESGEEEVA